jgi:formylglycine-generating enzyme required for sulfatase activity
MGSPERSAYRRPDEVPHRVRIGRSFAIAAREVTVAEYARFLDENPGKGLFRPERHEQARAYLSDPESPISAVDWSDCARYCNWLSRKEGIPESEWCYPEAIVAGSPPAMPADYLRRTGYRLPTEAEWELACRAGSSTNWPFGGSEEWLPRYAWFGQNAGLSPQPVGRMRPNDLGLFDILGNTFEWLQDWYANYPVGPGGGPVEDVESTAPVPKEGVRILRGGVFYFTASGVRSAARDWIFPTGRDTTYGFRPARTYP